MQAFEIPIDRGEYDVTPTIQRQAASPNDQRYEIKPLSVPANYFPTCKHPGGTWHED
jgi:hypothetical protein